MSGRSLTFCFISSIALGFAIRLAEIQNYTTLANGISSEICDVVQTRAQGGSTRDVYDQTFSFLRKHSPDSLALVEIKSGTKVIGGLDSQDPAGFLNVGCQIESSPDYRINLYYHRPPVLGLDLIERIAQAFLSIVAFGLIFTGTLNFLKDLWSKEIISSIRRELGLPEEKYQSDARAVTKAFGSWASHWVAQRLESIKASISALKSDIQAKQKKLMDSEIQIHSYEEISTRAKVFEEKVNLVRHDLKGPLSAMKLAVYNHSEVQESLPSIIQTVERILADLQHSDGKLNLADNQGIELEIAEVVALDTVKAIQLALGKDSQIQIDLKYQPDQLSAVKVRSDYLARVFSNLIQNSIESIGDQSGNISIQIEREHNTALIKISDNGPGISPDVLSRLFYRGSTFGKNGGSGLGLFFVKNCVETWDGSVQVSSAPGKGTVFSIRLPLEKNLTHLFLGPQIVREQNNLILVDDEATELLRPWNIPNESARIFETPQNFIEWWNESGQESSSPLVVDLHLRNPINGLDILRTIGQRKNTYLSSSDYLNQESIETVAQMGLKIIPKQLLFL